MSSLPLAVVVDNEPAFFSGLDDPALAPMRGRADIAIPPGRSGSRGAFLSRIEPAEILFYLRRPFPLDAEAFERARGLRFVTFAGVGTDHIDLEAARRRGVTISNLPGANAAAVAEHTIALLFAVARRIPIADSIMRSGGWQKPVGRELAGKTFGIVGLGAIGSHVGRLAGGLGMRVVGWSFREDPERAASLGVELLTLDDVLRQADVVSLHLRLTPESEGLLDRRRLDLLRPGAILINTARAGIVDETAVVERLGDGRVGGLGVDVYMTEPMTLAANPYLGLENVVMTPHLADETVETNERLPRLVVENVVAYLDGRPQNVVAGGAAPRAADDGEGGQHA